jgi:hypothetical protein
MTPTAPVMVELDKARELRYTNAALGIRLEAVTKQTVDEHLAAITLRGSLASITALVWAGLIHAEPDLTIEEAAERIDLARTAEIAQAIGEAYNRAMGASGKAPAANRATRRAKNS